VLEQTATGHPDQDAGLLLNAFRSGRLFSAIDAVASPAWVDYTATSGTMQVSMGEALPFAEGATVTFRSSFPQGGRLALYRDGAKVAEAHSGELRATAGGPGSYRVEVAAPRAPGTPPVPWIVTNPIYLVGQSSDGVGEPVPDYTSVLALSEPGRLEKDPESLAQLDTADARRVVQYRLRAGDRVSQYVALSLPMPQTRPAAFDAVVFDARAAAPMRVSVQLRFNALGGARWGSSVYLSPETRRIALPLEKLVSLDRVSTRPQMATASSILFVVDLTNAKPGWEGRFEISDLSLASTSRSAK
jgi:hypothetical protein